MDTQKPKISIVVVNLNGCKYLKRTIPVLQDLTYSSYEILVVDNGSTDGSLEYLASLEEITVLHSPVKYSKNAACNYAAQKTEGDYILFLDNDMLLTEKELLENLVTESKELDSFGCFGLSLYNEGEKTTQGYGSFFSYYFTTESKALPVDSLSSRHKSLIGYPHGAGIFIKKEVWNRIGGYEEYLAFGGDDNDIGMKLWNYGYKCYLYSKSVQNHIGIAERTDNKKYNTKHAKVCLALLFTIVKNCTFFNMVLMLFGTSLFYFLKSIKQSLVRRSIFTLFAYYKGSFHFLLSIPAALKRRKVVQGKRKVKKDLFLKVKP